jgi:hypothetical protein
MLILQERVCVCENIPTGWLRIQDEAYFRNRQDRIHLEIHPLKPASVFPFNISNVSGKGSKQKGSGKTGYLRARQLGFDSRES